METHTEYDKISASLQTFSDIQAAALHEYEKLLSFADEYKKVSDKEKRSLPYQINVIDELHINENGHSRILTQLLKFANAKGEYELLESLIGYIKNLHNADEWERIKVRRPDPTHEIARIDLWVRDTDYAIIFENKIYNANDQDAQLSRYIDRTKAEGYAEQDIFVVYLSQTGQEPDDQTWGDYKQAFADRYVNLSFCDDILPWLKREVLPNVREKDICLKSAVIQYIDYLEGLFFLKSIYKTMNMNLEKIISSHFELDKCKDDKERVRLLSEKIDDIKELEQQMDNVWNAFRQRIFDGWKQDVKMKYPDLEPGYPEDYMGVSMMIGKKKVVIRLSEDNNGLYCQVEYDYSLPERQRNLNNSPLIDLRDVLSQPRKISDSIWKYFGFNDYDEVYSCFLDVVEKCLKMMDK